MNRILRASARASLLAAALTFAAALPAFATVVTATGTFINDADPTNMATGFPNGPFDLTSAHSPTTDSYVDLVVSQTFSFNNIVGLSANFTDISGGAELGSPRFAIVLANGDFYETYLGTLPNLNDSNPAAFTTAYSGFNFDNGSNNTDSVIGGNRSATLQSFASFQAGPDGSQLVTNAYLLVDGGAGSNGAQELILNALNVQFLAAPEPATWTMMAAALGLLGFLVMRRRRNSAGTIAA